MYIYRNCLRLVFFFFTAACRRHHQRCIAVSKRAHKRERERMENGDIKASARGFDAYWWGDFFLLFLPYALIPFSLPLCRVAVNWPDLFPAIDRFFLLLLLLQFFSLVEWVINIIIAARACVCVCARAWERERVSSSEFIRRKEGKNFVHARHFLCVLVIL